MKTFKIYTCGAMRGRSLEKSMEWRKSIAKKIEELSIRNILFVHPPLYYNYDFENHKSEREVMEWELSQVASSDIVIVNNDGLDTSVGSLVEMGAIQAINMFGQKHIFVVGLGKEDEFHPWIKEMCLRIEENESDLAEFIAQYLLI